MLGLFGIRLFPSFARDGSEKVGPGPRRPFNDFDFGQTTYQSTIILEWYLTEITKAPTNSSADYGVDNKNNDVDNNTWQLKKRVGCGLLLLDHQQQYTPGRYQARGKRVPLRMAFSERIKLVIG